MGLLGKNAGVLGGIGQALQQNSANAREERLAALENERQMALVKMQQEFQSAQNDKDRTLTKDIADKDRQVQVGANMERSDYHKKDLALRESEGRADRESREKIAKIDANSRAAAAAARGNKSGWKVNKVATESMTKEGSMSKREDIVITSPRGTTFKQQGDMFVPQGSTPRIPKNRAAMEARLRENPEAADEFASTFGYLPSWYLNYASQGSEPATDEEE